MDRETENEIQRLDDSLLKFAPSRQFQYVTVTFPTAAGTDLDIAHKLTPGDPEMVHYEVTQSAQPCSVWHDSSNTRTAWADGLIRLRCSRAGGTVTLRLSVGPRNAGNVFLGTTRENRFSIDVPLGIGSRIDIGSSPSPLAGAMVPDWSLVQNGGGELLFSQNLSGGVHPKFKWRDFATTYAEFGAQQQIGGVLGGSGGVHLTNAVIDSLELANGTYERGRTTRIGEWIPVTFAAGNFTAATGSWTLASGDQTTFRYTLVGKTMTVVFNFDTTTVSNVTASLSVAIPGGFTAAAATYNLIRVSDNGGAFVAGLAQVTASGTKINFFTSPNGAAWAIATDTTAIGGQITFEIA